MSVSKLLSLLPVLDARRSAETIAAVDLGSNSFHLVVAQVDDGKIRVIDRLQEMVRLAAGLDARNRLSGPACQRALDCLARFGERLRGLPRHAVRAVGTNTLRRSRSADKFMRRAERALGHPIEIISGQEEARVIYQGVARELPDNGERRLVLDIGGGSTELIIGEGRRALLTESLSLGCVTLSRTHFATGRITPKDLNAAETVARLELQPIEAQFRAHGWTAAYGSSGTLRAVAGVIETQRWGDHGVTPATLQRLRDALLAAGHVDRLALAGLSPERAPVFPGGVAILAALFEALGVERLQVSGGALREGLLHDLVGRIRHEDVREQTIRDLSTRYQVDARQAERVAATARRCLAQVSADWQLDEADGRILAWGARLHEIGLAIAHSKYHRHGAYLVENSNLPGFSWQEQRLLAALIRGHRRRLPRGLFDELPRGQRRGARRLCLLLRLAVLLHRGRSNAELPALRLTADQRTLALRFPRGWLGRHPLTREDLVREAEYLQALRLGLSIR
jgi:exopolyphosphatase / guanosine-5'-triphosphate,3'-diphosphate pyrophosphatase